MTPQMLSSSSSSSKIPKRREYMVFTRHPLVGFLVLLLVARTSLASSVDALEQNARHLALDHVTCNKDEILLEIGAVTGDSIKYDWQVIDERTGEMFSSCKPSKNNNNAGVSSNHCYWTGKTMIYDRTCVPMDGCYRLVIGELHRPSGTDDNNIVEGSELDIAFGGERMFAGPQFQFTSVPLRTSQSSCTDVACERSGEDHDTTKGSDTSSSKMPELEIFLFYDDDDDHFGKVDDRTTPDVMGDLLIIDAVGIDKTTEAMAMYDRPRSFVYRRQCIQSCAKVVVEDSLHHHVSARIQVDGIIHREEESWEPVAGHATSSTTTYVGVCTKPSDICGPGQSLIQVDTNTIGLAGGHETDPTSDDEYIPTYSFQPRVYQFPTLEEEDDQHHDPKKYSFNDTYSSLHFGGGKFRQMFCIRHQKSFTHTGCTVLDETETISPHPEVISISVKVNGKTISDRIDCSTVVVDGGSENEYDAICSRFPTKSILIPLNGDGCKDNSKRNIIIIASSVSVVLLVWVLACVYYCCCCCCRNSKKVKKDSEEEEEENNDEDQTEDDEEREVVPLLFRSGQTRLSQRAS